jgi:hypothetical protein
MTNVMRAAVEKDDEHWDTGMKNPGFASRTGRDSIVGEDAMV